MMNTLIALALLLLLWQLLQYVWVQFLTDVHLNVAQAAVDASRCNMLFDQITNASLDVENVCGNCEFDLPFIAIEHAPTSWWFAIWSWDFWARNVVMEHSAANMQAILTEVEFL